jgi:hypothetical protein
MKNTLKVKLILVMVIFMLVSCTRANDFEMGKQQMLDPQGYTEIVNTGHSYFVVMIKTHTQRVLKAKDRRGIIVKGCFVLQY